MRAGCCVTKYSSTSFMASSPSYFFREIDVFRPWQCQASPWMVVNQGYRFKPLCYLGCGGNGGKQPRAPPSAACAVLWKDGASI